MISDQNKSAVFILPLSQGPHTSRRSTSRNPGNLAFLFLVSLGSEFPKRVCPSLKSPEMRIHCQHVQIHRRDFRCWLTVLASKKGADQGFLPGPPVAAAAAAPCLPPHILFEKVPGCLREPPSVRTQEENRRPVPSESYPVPGPS